MIRAVILSSLVLAVALPVSAQTLHVLKGRIVRALAIDANDPMHILVGHKAKAAGSALVFRSFDGGNSWRTLNGNKSLHPKATDVQAVLPVSKKILLAGTWKHGLYRSIDSGVSFQRVRAFPSADIRDLKMIQKVIYAATARHGVFESKDKGQTWKGIGPSDDFFWSLTMTTKKLFASSLEKVVYERSLTGGKWRKIFKDAGANAIAAAPRSGGFRVVASNKGLFVSKPKGWQKVRSKENFAEVIITRNNRILAGSWDKGIAVLTSGGHLEKRILPKQAVIHLQIANRKLYAGSWGDGLHILSLSEVLRRPGKDPALIAAVLADDPATVKRLIANGSKLDAVDDGKNTALTYAARDGQAQIARLLIEAGADPGRADGEGVTPLILASFKNHLKIVELLLKQKKKARPNHKDKWGLTALDYAERRGKDDPIYQLLNK